MSIKNAEREMRGQSDVFVVKTPDIKIPQNFQGFLNNGENKEGLFEILEIAWTERRDEINDRILYVARGQTCSRIDKDGNPFPLIRN